MWDGLFGFGEVGGNCFVYFVEWFFFVGVVFVYFEDCVG